MNNLDKKYQNLLKEIIETGFLKDKERTGTGTISIFGTQLRHSMKEGFPLLTTKKVYWKGIVHELLWFISGNTLIKYLVDNNVNIWVGDCLKSYIKKVNLAIESGGELLKEYIDCNFLNSEHQPFNEQQFIEKIKGDNYDRLFMLTFGDLGPIYGKNWRGWNTYKEIEIHGLCEYKKIVEDKPIDQIANLIHKLKTNPDDRRMIVNSWNVAEIDKCILPCCHYSFEVWTRELDNQERNEHYYKLNDNNFKVSWSNEELNTMNVPKRSISLKFSMRSSDAFLGKPLNLASYGLLLSMIGKVVNMIPEDLIFSGGDTHLYLNHIEQAKEQITREPFELPTVSFKKDTYNSIDDFTFDDIILNNYQSHETIKAPLSN